MGVERACSSLLRAPLAVRKAWSPWPWSLPSPLRRALKSLSDLKEESRIHVKLYNISVSVLLCILKQLSQMKYKMSTSYQFTLQRGHNHLHFHINCFLTLPRKLHSNDRGSKLMAHPTRIDNFRIKKMRN